MATVEERVSALEALLGTETRVQAGLEVSVSDVQHELRALHHTMRASEIKQDLTLEKVTRVGLRLDQLESQVASIGQDIRRILSLLADGQG